MTGLPVQILLVDDRTLPCRGLRNIIEEFPSVCLSGESRSLYDTLRECVLNRPDVVIVDAATPTVDGPGIVAGIQDMVDDPPPILSLVNEYDDQARRIVDLGAAGLLYMYSSPEELEAAVLMLGAGYSVSMVPPATIPRYSGDVDRDCGAGLDSLSEREFEVFKLIAQGCTNAEIACSLELRESTVKSHVQRILRKFNKTSRVELAVVAYEKLKSSRFLRPGA